MPTPGVIDYASLPDPLPPELFDQAANAGFGCARSPDGIDVLDIDGATAFFAAYVGSDAHIAYTKQQRLDLLAMTYAGLIDAGFNYAGQDGVKRAFQIDSGSTANVAAQVTAALVSSAGAIAWDPAFYWIAADNSHMPLATFQAMIAFGAAVGAYVSALILNNAALKAGIRTASSVEDVNAIVLTSGWPVNA